MTSMVRLESSPKLVEILHGSGVYITQLSLAQSSQCSSLVAGPPGAWASVDSPSPSEVVAQYPATPWPTTVAVDSSSSSDPPWHNALPPKR